MKATTICEVPPAGREEIQESPPTFMSRWEPTRHGRGDGYGGGFGHYDRSGGGGEPLDRRPPDGRRSPPPGKRPIHAGELGQCGAARSAPLG